MSSVTASLLRQTRRGFSVLSGRRTVDLSRLDRVPARLTWPLRRDGVDPVTRVAEVREQEPVHRLTSFFGLKVWMVTDPDVARAVLANQTDFSNDIRPFVGARGSTTSGDVGGLGFTDPPEHTRLRRLLTPQFTMRRLERLRPLVADIVERRLDEMRGPRSGRRPRRAVRVPDPVPGDLRAARAARTTTGTTFRQLSSARFDVSRGGYGTFGAVSQSRSFLIEATRRQRSDPGDGLIGDIIRAEGDAISDFDLAGPRRRRLHRRPRDQRQHARAGHGGAARAPRGLPRAGARPRAGRARPSRSCCATCRSCRSPSPGSRGATSCWATAAWRRATS